MALRERPGLAPRRPAPLLLGAAAAAAAIVAAAALAAPPPQHDAAVPEAAAAMCGEGQAPADPACAAGPPAAAPSGGMGAPDDALGRQERQLPEPAAPYATSGYADLPNPSNTTISAHSRPVAGEPLVVVVSTTLPLTATVMRGNGTIGAIEFPDGHTDGADTSVHVLFGGDVTVLSSDPALGAPSHGEAGGSTYTEIGGTLAATPGREYRFEFTVLPSEAGATVIDAAGFLRGAARLVLDVEPAAGRGAAGQQQSAAAAPDPLEREDPRELGPPGVPSPEDEIREALEAPRAGAPVPAPAGADFGIPAGGWAGNYSGSGPSGSPRAALPGPEPAAGGHGSRSHASRIGAADAGYEDLVLYGQIWSDLPYSDFGKPVLGLRVCATDVDVDALGGPETLMRYETGAYACTYTNEHGWYVLGPLDSADPDFDGTGPDLRIRVASFGDGVSVRDSTRRLYYEYSQYYLPEREAGNARLDMRVETAAMNGAARIVDTISDARAFFKEIGAVIPPVLVSWQYGQRVADAWPEHADHGDGFYFAINSTISLGGLESGSSYDVSESRWTIQHEYGHHVHNHLGGPGKGCKHLLTQKLHPECAFAEGFADFVPHVVDGAPALQWREHSYLDLERKLYHVGNRVDALYDYDDSTDKQTEMQVAGALWDMHDGPADELYDRKWVIINGIEYAVGDILDDLHMGADEIMRIVRDGPQSAEQFYARWEKRPGLGSMGNIMDLHRMPFNSSGDLPVFDAIPAVTVSHTEEAAVPVSAVLHGRSEIPLSVRHGFEHRRNSLGGAAVNDNGDGTGTLFLNPARADVGENFVVVRANSSGNTELARVDVTVTDPPKWAPVQLNSTFDRSLADWTREPGFGPDDRWNIVTSSYPNSPYLRFGDEAERSVYLDHGIDMTAYSSASLGLLRKSLPLEAGSYLRAYALDDAGGRHLIREWGADEATIGFQQEKVPLPADLMEAENLRIEFVAKGVPANPHSNFGTRIDDVTITGTPAGPAIEAPDDVRAEAAWPDGAILFDLGAPATYPAEGLAVTREPSWPFFDLGVTEVTWTATDAATGESDTDTQRVTVLDTTPPSVAPPADYTAYAAGAGVYLSADDYCAASAEDAVSDVIVLNDAPAYFPVGNTTTVSWLAMDRSGNPAAAEHDVTVVRSDAPHVPVSAVRAWADPSAPREPGSTLMIHVEFSHPVVLTAALDNTWDLASPVTVIGPWFSPWGAPGSLEPSLEMKGGGSAAYASGNGTDRLTFSYTVQPGETAPDYAGADALGGPCTIRSAADNRGAGLELPDPGPPGLPGPPGIPRVVDVSPDADAGDLVLFGHVWSELPYSDSRGPAHGLLVCVTDVDVDYGIDTWVMYEDGAHACTHTNERGLYVLGPLDRTDPGLDGSGPDLSIDVFSSGDGASVRDKEGSLYHERSPHYLPDREAGNARLDMYVDAAAMNGAARIVDAISDARAFIKGEIGVEIPPVTAFWQHGERAADAWPGQANSSDAFYQAFYSRMFLGGLDSNATYDKSNSMWVILHEYAHHAHNHLGGTPEGCKHRLTQKLSPGCAFGEGFADFFPHAVGGSPYLRVYEDVYIDLERELRHVGNRVDVLYDYDNSTDKQTEIQVAGALWDVHDEPADELYDLRWELVDDDIMVYDENLDDLHVEAGEIIRIVQDGPQSAEQFYARWEKQDGLGSMANIMDLHQMPFNSSDLPAFDAIPGITVNHTGEAAVPASATRPNGSEMSLSVRQGFDSLRDYEYGGAAMDDNGNGTGTLILRPAEADVGENFVVVRANSSGKIELARVDVTVTDPPKWAPVQLNSTFDRGFADWSREIGFDLFDTWKITSSDYFDNPDLYLFWAAEERSAYMDRGIDMTAYESAELGLLRHSPPLEAGSYLRAYAWDDARDRHLVREWGANESTLGFRAEAVPLPAGLMEAEDLRIEFAAKGAPVDFFDLLVTIDDVTITGTPAGPAIEAPGDLVAEAASPGGAAIADLGVPATYPAAGLAVTREPPGQSFPLGTTAVTWTATDAATGKSDSDTQLVAVLDTTPPSVAPPADYTAYAGGAEVSLSAGDYCAAAAEDAASDVIMLYAGPRHFPVGNTTTVSWLAADRSGNLEAAEQNVTVVRSDAPRVPVSAVRAWADPGAPREPGSTLMVHVNFSHPVALTAAMPGGAPGSLAPSLEMDGGGSAIYASGNGTDLLTFAYTVQPGEAAPDYAGAGALGGPCAIRSAADNRGAGLELPDPRPPGLPGPLGIPRVVDVFSDAGAGAYAEGRTIGIRVDFSEPVVVSGSPELLLDAGSPGAAATYANGSGTYSLAFEYVVRPGDAAADLDYSGTGALVLNGGSLYSPHGEAADLELPDPAAEPGLLPGPGKITVATVPRVVAVSSDAPAGAYGEGQAIGMRVDFSEPVLVEGSPELLLDAGSPGAAAAYAGGSGTSSLAFVYVVRPGDAAADLDYSGTAALVLNGGSVSSPHGEAADLELPDPAAEPGLLPGPGKITVATVPRVVQVSSNATAGVYGEGQAIGMRVDFSEPVLVEGFPELLLDAGSPGAAAAYAGGSGTHSLAFVYTVRPGDVAADLDYSGTAALVLNGGSVSSPHGTAADLELPDPAAEPGLLPGPGEIAVATKPHVRVGVFAGGPGDPSAEAARLGASAFNALSAERGYPFLVAVSEYALPAGASGAAAAAALRDAHDGGRGPALYVGPASDGALHGMAGYAAANGITLVSHSSAARSLAVGGDGIYRLEPGAAHLARVIASEIARGGYGAIVPVVQAGLHGPDYGLLESLESDLEPLGIPFGEPVAFAGGGGGAAAAPIETAVAAAAGSGTARNVAVVYVGSDMELAAMAGGVPAGGPVRERSAWFAAGGAGAGAGSGVAASPAILADAAAIQLARDVRLSAVQFAVERNGITDYIDRIAAPRGPATSATPAYAAYEAVRALGVALVLAGGDPSLAGGNVAGAAALDGGPLGRTGVDGSGDLRLPVTYGIWSVSDTAAEWARAPELLRGLDSCGIDLEKPALALPELSAGSTSRPARQTVTNVGTTPMPAVSVSATDWAQFRDGVPVQGQLPFSYTEMAVGLDGASPRRADSTPLAAGAEIPGGTPPGGSLDVDFRINLDGLDALDADFISQTVTFVVNCS